jgi:hypothetical protein
VQNSSWEANKAISLSRNSLILWNTKVHHHVHKGSSIVHTPSHINPIHTLQPYFPKLHLNISSHICLGHLNGLFSSDFIINIL